MTGCGNATPLSPVSSVSVCRAEGDFCSGWLGGLEGASVSVSRAEGDFCSGWLGGLEGELRRVLGLQGDLEGPEGFRETAVHACSDSDMFDPALSVVSRAVVERAVTPGRLDTRGSDLTQQHVCTWQHVHGTVNVEHCNPPWHPSPLSLSKPGNSPLPQDHDDLFTPQLRAKVFLRCPSAWTVVTLTGHQSRCQKGLGSWKLRGCLPLPGLNPLQHMPWLVLPYLACCHQPLGLAWTIQESVTSFTRSCLGPESYG